MSERQQGRLPGTTSPAAARGIAAMLDDHMVDGEYDVTSVARAIQHAIAKKGTKPHHFVEKSLDEIYRILGEELRKELDDGPDGGGASPPTSGPSSSSSSSSSSGKYRKNSDTYRGARIQTDHAGNRFADLKNGRRVYLRH
jgi:hypothetical protein